MNTSVKALILRSIVFLLINSSISILSFSPDTLVKIPTGYVFISDLACGDQVISYDGTGHCTTSVVAKKVTHASSYMHITCSNENLKIAKDHRVYLPVKKQWVTAQDLLVSDVLSEHAVVEEIFEENNDIELIDIALKEQHVFFVSHADVLVHNFFFTVPVLAYTIGQGAAWVTGGTLLGALSIGLFSEGLKKATRHIPISNGGTEQPGNFDPNEDDEPYGKYRGEGAKYHHQYSRGGLGKGCKSPAPKNGQRALNNSVEVANKHGKIKENVRIGIDNGEIVVLRRTQTGEYHGHVSNWEQLHPDMQNTLRKNGFTNFSGKILKHG